MRFSDYHSITPIKRADYSNSELLTFISEQILVGNYTNYYLLLTLLELPAIRQCDSLDIQESIEQIKAKCREQQTEQPCQHALTLQGTLYLFGVGYPQKEYAKAIACFEKAMTFNNSYAVNNLGYMYKQGLGFSGPKNPDEAARLYEKAVELVNPLAMNNLATLYEEQGGKNNIAKVIALYQQAIGLGHVGAMNNLALLYEKRGGTDNIAKAIALLQQAIELDDAAAMNNLAVLYEKRGGTDNIAKAIELLQPAIELGVAAAMNNLAVLYEKRGGTDNIAKAIALYQKAIALEHAGAMYNLATLYQKQGGTDSIAKAIALYQQAIELGHAEAIYNLAVLYQKQGGTDSIVKAIALYQRAIILGDTEAMNNLAVLYHQQGGTDNIAKAIALLQQAIELGDAEAMNNLAVHYYKDGGTDNIAKAIVLFEKALRISKSTSILDSFTTLYQKLALAQNQKQIMQRLLPLIWKDLLAGTKFTEQTLSALRSHCQQDVIERLKGAPEINSLAFLKQLKMDSPHPLALIISRNQMVQEKKWLGLHAMNLLETRWAFFRSIPQDEQNCPLYDLPVELQDYLFSFVQPGFEQDKDNNYFLTSMNLMNQASSPSKPEDKQLGNKNNQQVGDECTNSTLKFNKKRDSNHHSFLLNALIATAALGTLALIVAAFIATQVITSSLLSLSLLAAGTVAAGTFFYRSCATPKDEPDSTASMPVPA